MYTATVYFYTSLFRNVYVLVKTDAGLKLGEDVIVERELEKI